MMSDFGIKNDQVRLLMGQTLDEKFAGTWSTMDFQDLTKFADRFAELIVQECVKVCRDQPNVYALKTDRDNCAIAIEEHFGVEE